MATNCNICVENFNKSNRKIVSCEFCEFTCCRECAQTYVLDSSNVRCMEPSCGKVWSMKHVRKMFQLNFIKGKLSNHQGGILFQREQALFPQTQAEMERRHQLEKEIDQLSKYISELRELAKNEREKIREKYNMVTSEYNNEFDQQILPIYDQIHEYETHREHLRFKIKNKNATDKPKFVKACPSEYCRGFLNEKFGCGLCKTQFCDKCHGKKEDQHICNKDDVATVSFMAKDTKPCPKCGEGIYKIDGCDQMWCPCCHTAFSWRTGNVETNIHNPHYYEYMRKTGGGQAPRNPGDVPCGRVLDHHLTNRFYQELYRIKGNVYPPGVGVNDNTLEQIARNVTRDFIDLIPGDACFTCLLDFSPYIVWAKEKMDYGLFPIEGHLSQLCFKTLGDMIKTYPIKGSDIYDMYRTHIMSAEKKIDLLNIKIIEITRGGIHTMHHTDPPRYWTETEHYNLRRRYLLQKISKEQFIDKLLQDHNTMQFNNEIHDLLSMGTDTLRDILYRYLDTLSHIKSLTFVDSHPEIDVLPEIQRLICYLNDNLYEICHAYSQPIYTVNKDFALVRRYKTAAYLNKLALQDIPEDVSELYRKMLMRRRQAQQKIE